MLKMRLDARSAQLAIVTQLPEFIRVLLKMALEFLGLDKFLADFARTGFLDCEAGDCAEGIGHSVAEGVDLGHFEVVWFDLVALL
jgi:hypothetical protein